MRKLLLILALLPAALLAQTPTTIAPNIPIFGFQVLTGSTRQVNVQIGNPTPTTGHVITVALGSGGTGYTAACQGAALTLSQSGSSNNATVIIQMVSGGAVTAILGVPGGDNSANYTLANGVATTAPSACPGTGATVNITSVSQCAATGGYTCDVTWTVSATTGGASATFTDPSHTAVSSVTGLPTMQVNIGGTAGTCSISPPSAGYHVSNPGPYSVSSTATVTVEAQSVDYPSSVAYFTFNVCATQGATMANGQSSAFVWPAYQQAFQGQPMSLFSNVIGSPDPSGTWTLVSQPAGGNAVLSSNASCEATTASCRDLVITATVTGRYVLKYTSNATGGTAQGIVYVSPNALPTYTVTPNGTMPHEAYPDPANTGTDYEVNACGGTSYATINSVTSSAVAPGSIIRVHNCDTTGASPTVYNEYYQIITSCTPTQPCGLVGVPDASGNLPILELNGASAQAGFSPYAGPGYGGITTYPGPSYNAWANGSSGPSYWYIANFHVKDGNYNFPYNQPGGVSTVCSNTVQNGNKSGTGTSCYWNIFAACINIRGGSYIDVAGVLADNCGLGFFSNDNSTSLWGTVSQEISFQGNHAINIGINGYAEDHGAYLQGLNIWFQGNKLENWTAGMSGTCIKWRAFGGATRNNYCGAGPTRLWDGVETQSAGQYLDYELYLYYDGIYEEGVENIPADIIAAYQETHQNDYLQGLLGYASSNDQNQVHYFADVDNGMQDRNGTLWANFNTIDAAAVVFYNGESDPFNTYLQQRVTAQNNIFWSATNSTRPAFMANDAFATLVFNGLTNLYWGANNNTNSSSINISTPNNGGNWEGNSGQHGWQAGCFWTPCLWPLTLPLDPHTYNLTSGNYLVTTTQPYSATTMAPVTGSAAISAGTALTGLAALLPARWEFSVNAGGLIARTDTGYTNPTIGAVQGTPPPTLISIAITPTSSVIGVGSAAPFAGTCYYSDGTNAGCTSALTWNSSNTGVAVFSTPGYATGVAAGFVSVTATVNGITSNLAGLTVQVVPNFSIIGGSIKGATAN